MGMSDTLTFAIEGVVGLFIFIIFFSALAPTLFEYINNNSTVIGLPSVTILIVSLMVLLFALGIFMKFWKMLTQPERPEIQY